MRAIYLVFLVVPKVTIAYRKLSTSEYMEKRWGGVEDPLLYWSRMSAVICALKSL